MSSLFLERPRGLSPDGAYAVDWQHPLSRDIAAIVFGRYAAKQTSRLLSLTPSGSASVVSGRLGIGASFSGGADRLSFGPVPILASADPFSVEVLCSVTAVPSLAGFYGTRFISGDQGYARSLIAFGGGSNRNIYFWGQGSDLASGVDWRTDGSVQHVFVTRDGSTMRFYRDGVQIASGATPGLIDSYTTNCLGDTGFGWSSSPTGVIFKGATYAKCLSNGEIAELTDSPFIQCRQRRIWVPAGSSSTVPTITAVYADSVTTSSVVPRVTLDFA